MNLSGAGPSGGNSGIMSKPMLGSGGKAILPSNIIKPNKIMFKKKF